MRNQSTLHSRGERTSRPLLWLVLSLFLAATGPGTLELAWGDSENYCPGSPWNCYPQTTCGELTWCETTGGDWCNTTYAHYAKKKYLMVKRCTNLSGGELTCTSCGPKQDNGCCKDLSAEPSCPNGTQCP